MNFNSRRALIIGGLFFLPLTYGMEHTRSSSSNNIRELKNGGQATKFMIFCIQANVVYLLHDKKHGNRVKAFGELLECFQGSKPDISLASGVALYQYGFVDAEYKPYPHLKDIIVSMVDTQSHELKIVSPIK